MKGFFEEILENLASVRRRVPPRPAFSTPTVRRVKDPARQPSFPRRARDWVSWGQRRRGGHEETWGVFQQDTLDASSLPMLPRGRRVRACVRGSWSLSSLLNVQICFVLVDSSGKKTILRQMGSSATLTHLLKERRFLSPL